MNDTILCGQTIYLGIATTLSGRYASIGNEMKQAAELAVEEQNSRGGILGATVSTEAIDDQGNPLQGAEAARRLCSRNDLLGVVGHYSSDISIAASDVYAVCGLAMITSIASNPKLTARGLTNVFRYTNRDDRTSAALAGYLYHTAGKRRAAVVESQYAYGRSMSACFQQAFLANGGEILARVAISPGEDDFAPVLAQLPAGFDVLFYGGAFEGAGLLRTLRAAGVTQLFAAGDGCWDVENFLRPAAVAATGGEGVLVLSATPEAGAVPGSADFAERYRQRFGPIVNYAVNSYDAARVLMAAARDAALRTGAMPSRKCVLDSLRAIEFRGIACPRAAKWDDKGDNTAAVTALYTVEGGRFRQVALIDNLPAAGPGVAYANLPA